MGSAGSDCSGRAATGSLGSLSNPTLASLPAAELVIRLYSGRRRWSDFADAALVLADRERRAADAEARILAAGETEARLRAEIRALRRRADDAEARSRRRRLGLSDDDVDDHRSVAGEDDSGAGADDFEAREIDPELVVSQDVVAAFEEEEDGADMDADENLTLRQFKKKLKLLRRAEAESGSEESNTRGNDEEWGNLRALAIVSASHEDLLLDPIPLEVVPPSDDDLSPNHDLKAQKRKMSHEGNAGDDSDELQKNVQEGLSRAIMASPVLSASNKGSSVVAMHSEAGGGMKLDPSNSSMPRRATGKTRGNGMFYKMVFEGLKKRERSIVRAKAAAASQTKEPEFRCWLFAPEPSESVVVEDDSHGNPPNNDS